MGFTLYDPNMNVIPYPAGVTPLDISVSSIEKERIADNVDGIPGVVNYGFNYKSREIKLNFVNQHAFDTYDYRLQRDAIYDMLDTYPYMYVSDDKLPTHVLPITIDASYTPTRYGYWYSTFEVSANIAALPFWMSRFTTQHLQKNKYNAAPSLFGTADNINLDYLDYTFTTYEFDIWNGGDLDIDPRDMYIKYVLENATTSGGLTIENVTTGEKFVYNEQLNKQTITVNQTKVNVGVVNRLRDSNRNFPKIKKGLNHFKISNCTYSSIAIDFRFYYK